MVDLLSSANSRVAFSLFSVLPDAAAARGLAVAARAAKQRLEPPPKVDSRLEVAAREAKRTADNLARVTSRLETVVSLVQRARDKLDEIRDLLSDMRKAVVLSQRSDATTEEKLRQADRFDQFLGQINLKVRSFGTPGNNLLGSAFRDVFTAETVEFQTRPDTQVEYGLAGIFVASEFLITDSAGDQYVPDIFGAQLEKLPIDPYGDGTTILLKDDDTITLDNTTGAVTITRAGATTPILTGTLERKGLGVLFSPFYGHFLDSAKLDEALADIDAATAKIRFAIEVFDNHLARVTAFRDQNKARIEQNRDLVSEVESEKLRQQLEAKAARQREELLFSNVLQSTLSFTDQGVLTVAIQNLINVEV